MDDSNTLKYYPQQEEKINVYSHALGLALSMIALVFLLRQACLYGDNRQVISVVIYGISLILLYAASTIYHASKKPELRSRLRILDHASIYILIAGTYTPFTLLVLKGQTGWMIFWIVWGLALAGIILKLFFTGRFQIISILMYVLMSWVIIVFALKPLVNNLSSDGLFWLFAGGVAYTLGATIYGIKKIPYNHAIFHIFVLLGSACHFVSVYFYILPGDLI